MLCYTHAQYILCKIYKLVQCKVSCCAKNLMTDKTGMLYSKQLDMTSSWALWVTLLCTSSLPFALPVESLFTPSYKLVYDVVTMPFKC